MKEEVAFNSFSYLLLCLHFLHVYIDIFSHWAYRLEIIFKFTVLVLPYLLLEWSFKQKIYLHVYLNPLMDSHWLWGAIQTPYSDAHTRYWGTVSCLPPLPISQHIPKYVPDFITPDSSQLSYVTSLLLRLYFLEASSEPLLCVVSSFSQPSYIPSLFTTWHCSCLTFLPVTSLSTFAGKGLGLDQLSF